MQQQKRQHLYIDSKDKLYRLLSACCHWLLLHLHQCTFCSIITHSVLTIENGTRFARLSLSSLTWKSCVFHSQLARNHQNFVYQTKNETTKNNNKIVRRVIFSWCINTKYGLNRMICAHTLCSRHSKSKQVFHHFIDVKYEKSQERREKL